jgi:NitT/TauT family transport system permease protein
MSASTRAWLAPVLGVAVFLGGWQFLVRALGIEPYKLPAPSEILGELFSGWRAYLDDALVTGREAITGFLVALVLALIVGTLMAHNRWLEQAGYPVAVLVQVTPIIAYAPAIVIWVGFGFRSIVIVTAVICFVPLLFNTVTGLRSIDQATHELLRSVDANRREVFWHLRLPHALPYLFTAARISVGLALIGALLAEGYALVTDGLGVSILRNANRGNVVELWADIYATGLLGALGIATVSIIERLTLHWHPRLTVA